MRTSRLRSKRKEFRTGGTLSGVKCVTGKALVVRMASAKFSDTSSAKEGVAERYVVSVDVIRGLETFTRLRSAVRTFSTITFGAGWMNVVDEDRETEMAAEFPEDCRVKVPGVIDEPMIELEKVREIRPLLMFKLNWEIIGGVISAVWLVACRARCGEIAIHGFPAMSLTYP